MRVTVEICPGGDDRRKREIACIEISNVSELAETSDYVVDVLRDDMISERLRITKHRRSDGWLPLLCRVLEASKNMTPRAGQKRSEER